MKLDYWNNKLFTIELDSKHMSAVHKWPMLDSILDAVDAVIAPTSESKTGRSIYIGWAHVGPQGKPDTWFYHHAICRPRLEYADERSFGFTVIQEKDQWHAIASSNQKLLSPVFNVGALPESATFVKILKSHGILAAVKSPALSIPELIKK